MYIRSVLCYLGDVTVASSLASMTGVYVFSMMVTDGCNVSPQYNLTINVQDPTTVCSNSINNLICSNTIQLMVP